MSAPATQVSPRQGQHTYDRRGRDIRSGDRAHMECAQLACLRMRRPDKGGR